MNQEEIMQKVESMLFDFVNLCNAVKEDINSPKVSDAVIKLAEDYYELIDNKIAYFSILDKEFADDSQLYILVLSALFLISKDVIILDKVEKLLLLDDLPLDVSLRILGQVGINRFSNGFPLSEYSYARELHRHLLQRLEGELDVSGKYIPYEERNHNLIILETDTLLSDSHAPSRMVMEIYKILKYKLGYEVFLIVDFLRIDTDNMEAYWMFPYRARYLPKLNGDFIREYDGIKIIGYQQVVMGNDIFVMNHTAEKVYTLKPEFVWHIGGQSVLSDVLAKITTLVSMSCTDGFAVSEAPILAGYMQINQEMNRNMEQYIHSHGQETIRVNSIMSFDSVPGIGKEQKNYSPADFGIPEGSFIMAIVGNRLDTELTDEFIEVMKEIVDREINACFLVIGKCIENKLNVGQLKGRVICLEFQEDLSEVLKVTNLFVNPPRQGGGGGAACSLFVGVPVVTLPNCDVANLGEEFVCGSLKEFPDVVSRYCHDREFYNAQVKYCEKRCERYKNMDTVSELKNVVLQIKELCQLEDL